MRKLIIGLLCLLNIALVQANPQSDVWFNKDNAGQVTLNVDLFLSSTCSHCHKMDVFFQQLEKKDNWLTVHRYIINQDKSALKVFNERLQQQGLNSFMVPALFFCDSRWTGFADDKTTGKAILRGLNFCRQKIKEQGILSASTSNVLKQWGIASQFQISPIVSKTATTIILSSAMTDAFIPCSLFSLVAFFAFLCLYPAKPWMQFTVGIVYILALGCIHYIQQVYASVYYQNILQMKLFVIGVGLLLLLFMGSYYRKTRLYRGMKHYCLGSMNKLFSVAVVILTVWAVQAAQQTCLFNASIVLEQWLMEQTISPAQRMFYRVGYEMAYLLPLTIIFLLYLLISKRKQFAPYLDMLTFSSWIILVSIGAILVIYAPLLAHLSASIMVLFVSLLLGWYINRRQVKK